MKLSSVLAAGILAATAATGSGCATRTVYVSPPELPLPARPDLPRITGAEFIPLGIPEQCRDQRDDPNCLFLVHLDTLVKVVERERKTQAHAERLEAIIESTRQNE
ncbi:MAG TPA: hypothetical protein VK973_02100 [Arenicellales bacterium]|nr:hypothetical protein [Arenicellales bacterium]